MLSLQHPFTSGAVFPFCVPHLQCKSSSLHSSGGPVPPSFSFCMSDKQTRDYFALYFYATAEREAKKRNKKNKRNAKGTMTSTYCISNSALACVPKNGFSRIIRNIRARAQSGFVRCLRIVYISSSLCPSIWLHIFFFLSANVKGFRDSVIIMRFFVL